jgi:hypothetical protein
LTGDLLTIHGSTPRQVKIRGRDLLAIRLANAVRFQSRKGDVMKLDGGNDVRVDAETLASRFDPYGGTFANMMVPYLIKKDNVKYADEGGDSKTARSALPPPLVREGEKVQPEWLFGFLRNPFRLRPATVLAMPKFNMSEDEAKAIVNYFGAADKTSNPGIGLTYPYMTVPQRQETYWQDRNREYVDILAKEKKLDDRAKKFLDAAQKALEGAKDAEKPALEAEVKRLKEALDEKDEAKRKQRLAQTDLYWNDAYRLLTVSGNDAICLKCHRIGSLQASEEQGPPLDLSSGRLRPDWTERWIGNPNRLLTYPTPMPQNFPNGKDQFRDFFDAPSGIQVRALRDVLMNYPRVAELPVNRSYRPATSGGK